MLIGGCPGPSVGVKRVVLSVVWCLIQCSPCLSQKSWLSSCAVNGLWIVSFGCVVSRFVEGAALGLHIFCGACSWVFDLVGGVAISRCGCELCLVGVVFDVALRVGVIFLLNLVSPVQLSPSSLRCSSCFVLALALVC